MKREDKLLLLIIPKILIASQNVVDDLELKLFSFRYSNRLKSTQIYSNLSLTCDRTRSSNERENFRAKESERELSSILSISQCVLLFQTVFSLHCSVFNRACCGKLQKSFLIASIALNYLSNFKVCLQFQSQSICQNNQMSQRCVENVQINLFRPAS